MDKNSAELIKQGMATLHLDTESTYHWKDTDENTSWKNSSSGYSMEVLLTRPGFWRVPRVGDFFNAVTDALDGTNIFLNGSPEKSVRSTDIHFTEYRSFEVHSIADYFEIVGAPDEVQLSLLAKLLTPEGSWQALGSLKDAAHERKLWLLRTKIKDESVNFLDESLRKSICKIKLKAALGIATHVVVGISYGATMLMSSKVRASGGKGLIESERLNESRGGVEYIGDVPLSPNQIPEKSEDIAEFMRNAPSRMANLNGGKGVPQTIRLMPIHQVLMYLEEPAPPKRIYGQVGESLARSIVRAFDQLFKSHFELEEFVDKARSSTHCIQPSVLEAISKLFEETDPESFRPKLATDLVAVRSAKSPASKLLELVTEIRETCTKIQKAIKANWGEVTEKISIAKLLEKNGIRYIGIGAPLESELLDLPVGQNIYLLYISQKWKREAPENWTNNVRLLLDKSEEERGRAEFLAVDCELQTISGISSTCIQVVEDGKVIVAELLAEEQNTEK